MKCLILHCRKFSYQLDHATPVADPVNEITAKAGYDDAIVVLTCVEAGDQMKILADAAKDLRRIARKAGAKQIIINPFAHLSTELAPADLSREILNDLVRRLKESWDGPVQYTGFGWYKAFTLEVQGHVWAQLFRDYSKAPVATEEA